MAATARSAAATRARTMSSLLFSFPPTLSERSLVRDLRQAFELVDLDDESRSETLYDTFDWRLLDAGLELLVERETRAARLRNPTGRIVARARLDGEPGFTDDLPEGELQELVRKPLSMRRVLPFAHADRTRRRFALVDDEGKTRVRIAIETATVQRASGPPGELTDVDPGVSAGGAVRMRALRGYEADGESVAGWLESRLGSPTAPTPLARQAAETLDLDPLGYQPKVALEFEPTERTDSAMRRIYRQLLDVILANEPGTRDDLDSEFLHDLRVAVRRTRSGLSQVRDMMPRRDFDRFRREFKWLGNVTGPQRDADVALLTLPDYLADLPEDAARHLEPLRELLVEEQRDAHRQLVRDLDSARYRRLIRGWTRFLDRPVPARTRLANARRPIRDVASDVVWKAYRRVRKRGRRIDDDTPDAAVHDLRIDAKKLRYVLAFFQTLFDGDEVSALVKQLKKLQDNLGTFNDLSVQQESLREHAERIAREQRAGADTLLAIGRLVELLAQRQRDERQRFRAAFEEFGSTATRDRVRELLGRVRS